MRNVLAGIAAASFATAALADTPPPTVQPDDRPAASVWRAGQDGAYEHILTGLVCPSTLGIYRRRSVQAYDSFGLDVGCAYAGKASGVSVFLTHRDEPALETAMGAARRELEEAHAARHPKFVSESRTREGDIDRSIVTYSRDGDMRELIWLEDLSSWTLEYRATYSAADEPRVMGEVGSFAEAARTATAPRLQACAKAAPAERRGKPVTDKGAVEASSMMTSILGGAMQIAVAEGEATETGSTIPCLERAGVYAGFPLVFLRNVSSDGSDALSDAVTAISAGPPIIVRFSGGGLAALLADKPDQPQEWAATYDREGQTLIFGYFSGRPTIDQMGDLVANMLSGKAKPVGGYGAKGKNITIMRPPK